MIYDNADTEKIQGFPLDSDITGYYPDGLPIYSNEYKSVKLRRAISSLISDGIIAMKGQEGLKVAIDGSASNFSCSLKAKSGQAVIGGCILSFGNFNDDGYGQTTESTDYVALQNVIVSSPTSPGTRYTDIYIGFSEDYTDKSAFIKAVQRSSGTEILKLYRCLCLATVKSVTSNVSGSYVYSHTVIDLRASSHCGFAAPFVEVDTSMYYDELTNVLNDAWERADESIAELEEKTQVAVEVASDALEGVDLGNIYSRLDDLETDPRPISLGGTGGTTQKDAADNLLVMSLGRATSIPANTNMNDLLEPGNYVCQSDAVVSTLLNKPSWLTHAFRMWVFSTISSSSTGGSKGQLVLDYLTGRMAFRYANPNDYYGTWFEYAQESDTGFVYPVSGSTTTYYRVKNNVIYIGVNTTVTLNGQNWVNVFQLPNNYHNRYVSTLSCGFGDVTTPVQFYVKDDGYVQVRATSASVTGSKGVQGSIIVPLN